MIEKLGLALMHRLDPEQAHGLALKALNARLGPRSGPVTSPRLRTTIAGMDLPNPVGLAAGFDKNADALGPLSRSAFGFLEIGATTPRPQPGNPKPRLFRLTEDAAAINRFGFNNNGMEEMARRLAIKPQGVHIGLNLGANKDSRDRSEDFASVLQACGAHIDFATVNVSSPNTEKLRDLQGKAALTRILDRVIAVRDVHGMTCSLWIKIAPDLDDDALNDIAEIATTMRIDGVIATNTTLDREGLHGPHAQEAGGLSGQPLFEKSTRVLARLSQLTEGRVPLIGVGGVSTAEQAYTKIRAGASAVQLYTALVYGGISLAGDIARGLDALLARDGFDSVAQAVGTDRDRWLYRWL